MIKKLFYLFISFLLIFSFIYSSEKEVSNIKKISKDFYVVQNFGGNVAFMITEEGVLVVDSGTSLSAGKQIVDIIKDKTNMPIKYVILTHYHNDHIMGLDAFPDDIKVISSNKTKENITNISLKQKKENVKKRYPKYIENMKKKLKNLEDKESNEYKKLKKQIEETETYFEEYKKTEIIIPNKTFEQNKSLKIGNEIIELIKFPNTHTSGISVVYFKNRKVLHISDLIFNKSFPYIDYGNGANTENWIEALESIKEINFKTLIPGHGNVENSKKPLERQIEYFKTMRKNIQNYIGNEVELEKIEYKLNLPQYDNYAMKRFYKQNIEAIYNELIKKNN